MSKRKSNSVRQRMQALMAELDYDFDQFTLEDFARWIQQKRGRSIVFVPYPLETPGLSAAWLADEDHDYVFYAEDSAGVYRAHIQLHELSHMLAGHKTAKIDPTQLLMLFGSTDERPETCGSLFLRSAKSDEAEQEAETLASLIQERVLRHAKVQEAFEAISSEGDLVTSLTSFMKAMEAHNTH